MRYTLTDSDLEEISKAVSHRIEESAKQNLNHATTYVRPMSVREREETVGAGAELAWDHLNGRPWRNPINEFHRIPDDGKYEVRATDHPRGGLIVRDNDPLDRAYIFATYDHDGSYTFHGWAYGHEVATPSNQWNPYGRRPAWRMDRKDLRPMNTLSPQ